MKVRAAIFDIYGTLLQVGSPPADAETRWSQIFETTFSRPPVLNLLGLSAACRKIVAQHHEKLRKQGIVYPEIVWPQIVCEALPEARCLKEAELDEFIFSHIQLTRSISLNPEVPALLQRLREDECFLGIASNAQAYTLRELRQAFSAASIDFDRLFDPALSFWSFDHGFSKPNPHVFRILTARLEARRICPSEILMVGDRLDNDIEPARAHGWRTWWLSPKAPQSEGGTLQALGEMIFPAKPREHQAPKSPCASAPET